MIWWLLDSFKNSWVKHHGSTQRTDFCSQKSHVRFFTHWLWQKSFKHQPTQTRFFMNLPLSTNAIAIQPIWRNHLGNSRKQILTNKLIWWYFLMFHLSGAQTPAFFQMISFQPIFTKVQFLSSIKQKKSRGAIRRWSWNSHHQTEEVVMFPIAACCTCVHISCFNFNPEKPLLTNGPSWIAHGAGLFPFAHMDGGKSWCFGPVSTWNLWCEPWNLGGLIDRMQRFHFLSYCNLSDTSGLSNNRQYKLCNYISRVNWSLMLRHTKLTEFQLSAQTWNSKLVPSTAANSACDASQVCWTSTLNEGCWGLTWNFLKTYGLSIVYWRYVIYCTVYVQYSAYCDISRNQQSKCILS